MQWMHNVLIVKHNHKKKKSTCIVMPYFHSCTLDVLLYIAHLHI